MTIRGMPCPVGVSLIRPQWGARPRVLASIYTRRNPIGLALSVPTLSRATFALVDTIRTLFGCRIPTPFTSLLRSSVFLSVTDMTLTPLRGRALKFLFGVMALLPSIWRVLKRIWWGLQQPVKSNARRARS